MRLVVTAAVALTLGLAANAQTTQRLSATKANDFAITYTLPQTQLEVTLAATHTVKTPGEFALYAKRYLNIDPILKASESWTVSGAEIRATAIVDTDEVYAMQFKGGNVVTMLLTAEGFPLSINDNGYEPIAPAKSRLTPSPATPTPLDGDAARQAMTQEMLQSTSVAKRAQLAADRIFEIRQQRNDMLVFEDDNRPDGEALRLALEHLKMQEDALTAMFTGTVSTSVEVADYTVMPPANAENGRVVVARLSATDGLVDADNLSGMPVYVDFSDVREAQMPVNDNGEEKPFPKGGVAYRIPGQVTASVVFDGRSFAKSTFDVAQYGIVYGADPKLFTDKKAPASMRFSPLTGAVIEKGIAVPAQ